MSSLEDYLGNSEQAPETRTSDRGHHYWSGGYTDYFVLLVAKQILKPKLSSPSLTWRIHRFAGSRLVLVFVKSSNTTRGISRTDELPHVRS